MADQDAGLTPAPAVDESYGPPPPVAEKSTPGKAIGSLVCGIISLLFFGIILGTIAVVLGIKARGEIAANPGQSGGGMALAGIITGALGIVFHILIIIVTGAAFVGGG